jgi:hypothetical protein
VWFANFYPVFRDKFLKKCLQNSPSPPSVDLPYTPLPPPPTLWAGGRGELGTYSAWERHSTQAELIPITSFPPSPAPVPKTGYPPPTTPPKRGHSFLRNSLTEAVYHLFLAEFYLAAPGSFELVCLNVADHTYVFQFFNAWPRHTDIMCWPCPAMPG